MEGPGDLTSNGLLQLSGEKDPLASRLTEQKKSITFVHVLIFLLRKRKKNSAKLQKAGVSRMIAISPCLWKHYPAHETSLR